jgi:amino acid transporter
MQDYKDRKMTLNEKLGVFSAIGMFFSVGMMMGGNSAGNYYLMGSGATLMSLTGGIALYLLFWGKKKEKTEE